jgi:uncharacterized protein YndB with AHSA1/START domain
MARSEIVIDAPPEKVYATLLDANAYSDWVVGAQKIRGVDRGWPRIGSRFHHKVGVGPAALADSTKIIDKKLNKRVVLEVRIRPAGVGNVTLDLKPTRRGRKTKVVMTERIKRGPLARIPRPGLAIGLRARNALSLRRLRRLVASRHEAR